MKNEPNPLEVWPEIRERGSAALCPYFAQRVFQRVAVMRDELSPRVAWTVGLSTAVACLALTLAINRWASERQTEKAIEAWNAFTLSDNIPDQEI